MAMNESLVQDGDEMGRARSSPFFHRPFRHCAQPSFNVEAVTGKQEKRLALIRKFRIFRDIY